MKKKTAMLNKGFSLIEMLVVVAVFSVIAVIATQSLTTSLRGTRKSESLGHVRENVEYAMNVIERSLRGAKELDCPSSSGSKLEYFTSSGASAYFECSAEHIASNSAAAVITSNDIRVINCGTVFMCVSSIGGVPGYVNISVTAQESDIQGAESAEYTSSTRILLRNY